MMYQPKGMKEMTKRLRKKKRKLQGMTPKQYKKSRKLLREIKHDCEQMCRKYVFQFGKPMWVPAGNISYTTIDLEVKKGEDQNGSPVRIQT